MPLLVQQVMLDVLGMAVGEAVPPKIPMLRRMTSSLSS